MAGSHVPTRKVPSGHSRLKQGRCALSPSAEYCSSSTAAQVRSALLVHGVASCSPAPQLEQRAHLALPGADACVPSSHAVFVFSPLDE